MERDKKKSVGVLFVSLGVFFFFFFFVEGSFRNRDWSVFFFENFYLCFCGRVILV